MVVLTAVGDGGCVAVGSTVGVLVSVGRGVSVLVGRGVAVSVGKGVAVLVDVGTGVRVSVGAVVEVRLGSGELVIVGLETGVLCRASNNAGTWMPARCDAKPRSETPATTASTINKTDTGDFLRPVALTWRGCTEGTGPIKVVSPV